MNKDFKVADISLADFGRREISLAENEMPALMALREKYKDDQPFSRCKDYGLYTYDNSNSSIDGNFN